MRETPAPSGPGRNEDPPGTPPGLDDHPSLGSPHWQLVPDSADWPDWMDDAWLADEDPGDLEDYPDPDNAPLDVDDAELAVLLAGAREVAADQARAAEAMARPGHTAALAAGTAQAYGRRGPGLPGSAESFPAQGASPAAGFASGQPLDTAPGCLVLAQFAEAAAGEDDRYPGASDDELAGVLAAWDRIEAHVCSRKHAASAELIRRRPADGCTLAGPAQMPEAFDEFTPRELGAVLGETRAIAGDTLSLAYALEVNLPGTRAAFRDGTLGQRKAMIIASATALLDPEEAWAAEAKVLGRAGALTPPGLRAAITRAVMEVAPGKAKARREHEAKKTRVERWCEPSGNAGLAGRELPPAQVLAADQRVTAWAKELRKAGLDGGMDELRARAYLDILLGMDSRPPASRPDRTHDHSTHSHPAGSHPTRSHPADSHPTRSHPDSAGPAGCGGSGPYGPWAPPDAGPLARMIPPGFAGHVTLTIPAATLTGLADRPGELGGIGPIDPDLARDLARAAARNPRSTWCVTVTDSQGHAIGHGCARPAPGTSRNKRHKPGMPGGPGPPGPSFTFTPTDASGPPGGYGTWRFTTRDQDLLIRIGPIPAGDCDHRHQAKAHDPGVMLRHLAQVRHATCTGPGCRRPAASCDFEHNVPYDAGGRTCLCNGNPKCRHDHRLKQHPRWHAEQLPDGSVRWTTPAGRHYTTEPTRYPI